MADGSFPDKYRQAARFWTAPAGRARLPSSLYFSARCPNLQGLSSGHAKPSDPVSPPTSNTHTIHPFPGAMKVTARWNLALPGGGRIGHAAAGAAQCFRPPPPAGHEKCLSHDRVQGAAGWLVLSSAPDLAPAARSRRADSGASRGGRSALFLESGGKELVSRTYRLRGMG